MPAGSKRGHARAAVLGDMKPEHFSLHEVVAGVWLAEADLTGASVGNAVVIDAGGKTVVVDTFMTGVAAAELRRTAEKLTGNEVYLAVNSHWHPDHTNGNQVFADVPIVSTRRTMEAMIETAPTDIEAWQEEIDASIVKLRDAATAGDENAARRIGQLDLFRSFAGEFSLTLPDLLIDGQLDIQGERRVEVATLGRGHTVSDTFVWLPAERVLVTGDLCWNGIHPRLHDGFPADWAEYTLALLDLDPAHVLPGHGPPGDREALQGLPEYFRAVAALVKEVRAGADPSNIAAPASSGEWDGLSRLHDGLKALASR